MLKQDQLRQRYQRALTGHYSPTQLQAATLPQLRMAALAWKVQVSEEDWTAQTVIALRSPKQPQTGQADWGPTPVALKSPPKR